MKIISVQQKEFNPMSINLIHRTISEYITADTLSVFSTTFLTTLTLIFLAISPLLQAEINNYPFERELEEKRFTSLLGELRCPKCQNQSLADSDAEIAKDLRQRVYDLLKDNKSDEEIRNYLIERYGDFVSYRPPLNLSTSVLWFGPFILLLLSIVIAVRLVKSANPSSLSTIKTSVADENAKPNEGLDDA